MESGRPSTVAGYAGATAGCGSGFGQHCNRKLTVRAGSSGLFISSTARLCVLTNTPQGQKKQSRSRSVRPESRWTDHESPCSRRWSRTTLYFCTHARPAARRHDGRDVNATRRNPFRPARTTTPSSTTIGSRQSIWFAPVQAPLAATWYSARYSAQAQPETRTTP